MATAYISHPDCLKHDIGENHPESSARLNAIENKLIASGLMAQLLQFEAPQASIDQLARVHPRQYIGAIHLAAPQHGFVYLDPDTSINPHTWNAALHAAWAVVLAVDLVMTGTMDNAFCAIRPPGHHAESARAMGFFIFNNVAVGVAHALTKYGLQHVAIADFDVHHGNGTEEIFHNDERVMLCSTFQHPYYPYRRADSGNEHIINVPLPAGTDGAAFYTAVEKHWLPALERFQPQMIFFSTRFDAHRDDDLTQMALTEADYTWVTQQVKNVADRYAQGRMVSVLEGGYHLRSLARSVEAHIRVLSGM